MADSEWLLKYAESEANSENKDVWDYMALCCNQSDWLNTELHSESEKEALKVKYLKSVRNNPYTNANYENFVETMQSSRGGDQYTDTLYRSQANAAARMKVDEHDTDDESLPSLGDISVPESEGEDSDVEDSDDEDSDDEESEASTVVIKRMEQSYDDTERQDALSQLSAKIKHLQSKQSYVSEHKAVMRAKQLVRIFIQ